MSKEKLMRELKFIEDSYSSNIISKEEYDEAKKRIDDKLAQIPDEEEIENPPKIEEHTVEVYHEPEKETQETLEQPSPSNGLASSSQPSPQKKKIKLETYGKSKKKPIILTIIALVLIVIIFYSIQNIQPSQEEEVFNPVCDKDFDCQKTGFVGICQNPSSKEANCTFQLPAEIEVTIINDKDCKLCSTRRIENTIKQIYPGAKFITVDKKDSTQLLNKLDISVLPTVLFDESVQDTYRFEQTSSMLIKQDEFYIMKPQATGSPYFFINKEKPKHIALFIDPDSTTSEKAYKNLVELARLWDLSYNIYYWSKNPSDETNNQLCIRETDEYRNYMTCFFSEKENCLESVDISNCNPSIETDSEIADSFFINSVPTFIVNNQYKKGGSLSVELLEELYCNVNNC